MEFKNGITQRYYLCINICLESPLCVSGGESEYTDRDIERDFDGNPFVAGTSLAGAFRSFLLCSEKQTEVDRIFGYIDNQNGYQSRFSFSDLTFENGYTISVRNQTKLEQKVAASGSKFDLENIEKGAAGTFYIEIEFRENDSLETSAFRFLKKIIFGINSGDIAFGSNKSSGFGRFSIKKIYGHGFGIGNHTEPVSGSLQEYFSKEHCYSGFSSWLDFDKYSMKESKNELDIQNLYPPEKISLYTTLKVPLKLSGTVNIRQYITKYGEEDDSVHIYRTIRTKKSRKEIIPIIPGSSWRGAIRSQCERILQELGISEEGLAYEMFGFIEKNAAELGQPYKDDADKASISAVFFEESDIIENHSGHYQPVTRNQINRFTGSTVNHALLQEQVYVYGKCTLTIHIRKNPDKNGEDKNAWMTGLLLIAIQDLQNGYLAVGGETGIGRGIFEPDGNATLSDNGTTYACGSGQIQKYLQKLAEKKEGILNAE